MEDGGYFAIIGFEKQFQQSLEEILNSADENANIKLEDNEDIETFDSIIQVKYCTKTTQSANKDHIIKLFNKYCQDSNYQKKSKIKLCGYYKGEMQSLDTKTILDTIEGCSTKKQEFISKFTFVPSQNYENSRAELQKKLQEEAYLSG